MAKESLYHIDKRCIFRETFNSEEDVRRNGGVPTDAIFSNGICTINRDNSSLLKYYLHLENNTYSFRIRYKINEFQTSTQDPFFLDLRNDGIGYIIINEYDTQDIDKSSGLVYINGVSNNIVTENIWQDVIVVGITLYSPNTIWSVGCWSGTYNTQRANWDIDLIEIYKGTLTAEEVSLLYGNRLYRKPIFNQKQILSSNYVPSASSTFETDGTEWWYNYHISSKVWNSGTTDMTVIIDGSGASYGVYAYIGEPQYTRVKVTFKAKSTNNTNSLALDNDVYDANPTNPNLTTEYQDYKWEGSMKRTNGRIYIYVAGSLDDDLTIDDIIIEKISQEELTEVLSINPLKGVIEDKYGNNITNTDVNIVKDNGYKMKFNGSTSKIDIGYDIIGTDDITAMAWIKAYNYGLNLNARIIDNGKFLWFIRSNGTKVGVASDGITLTYSAGLFQLNKFYFLAVTRTSVGIINHYRDGIINGVINQNAGTPALGTENLEIGFSPADNNNYFDGLIGEVKIIQGILTAEQIMQYYQSTKNNYIG